MYCNKRYNVYKKEITYVIFAKLSIVNPIHITRLTSVEIGNMKDDSTYRNMDKTDANIPSAKIVLSSKMRFDFIPLNTKKLIVQNAANEKSAIAQPFAFKRFTVISCFSAFDF